MYKIIEYSEAHERGLLPAMPVTTGDCLVYEHNDLTYVVAHTCWPKDKLTFTDGLLNVVKELNFNLQ